MATEIPKQLIQQEAQNRWSQLSNRLTWSFWIWLLFFPPLFFVMLLVGGFIVMVLAAN